MMALLPTVPLRRPVAWLLALPIVGYRRLISPLLRPACRFEPSCSTYALWALQTHQPWSAAALVGWRLLRCQPFCAGGIDWPPPGPFGTASDLAATADQRRMDTR